MASTLDLQAAGLIRSLGQQCSHPRGFGSMSPSVYDTAWVSMIENRGHDLEWLFPECFERLMDSQGEDGAWESYASPVDGIMNTAAGLLAIQKHLRDPGAESSFGIKARSAKAEAALRRMLDAWDITSCDHVGFEVLVTRHLEYLEDEGVLIDIPARHSLRLLEETKLAKLPLSYVEAVPSTLTHSLEAFIGKVDFDRMGHLRTDGSMLASPSSTAAYLMNVTQWDHEAEAYLHAALGRTGTESRSGLLPCAWPTTIFELSWVVTALQEGGFSLPGFGQSDVDKIGDLLEKTFTKQGGVVGFTFGGLPDADDTARITLALHAMGKKVEPKALISTFEGKSHFQTYKGERNPSFSTNCNVAAALLVQEDPSPYLIQIQKCMQFLTTDAFQTGVKDKWNISEIYPKMLLSQTLLLFLTRLDDGSLDWKSFPTVLLHETIPIVALHVLGQILHSQKENGSWGSMHEVTAYAVLALVALASFPWMQHLQLTINIAISRGKRFLEQRRHKWAHGDYLWIEKVTYSSGTLSLAYCLSAARAIPSVRSWGGTVKGLNDVSVRGMTAMCQFFSGLPLFSTTQSEQIEAAFIQSHSHLRLLKGKRLDIFPRKQKEDSYLQYVPFTWTSSNNQVGGILDPFLIHEMIVLSVLMYEADEFMETAVEGKLGGNLGSVKALVSHLCSTVGAISESQVNQESEKPNGHQPKGTNGLGHTAQNGHIPEIHKGFVLESHLVEVEKVLRKFVLHLLTHPVIIESHPYLKERLRRELEIFLLAHVTHAEDNARIAIDRAVAATNTTTDEGSTIFTSAGRTYYQWVRSTSANHTSCPFAFVFFSCLIAPPGTNPFPGPRQMYVAEDLCRHLATMCRQYNDYGSVTRDQLEQNLNSVDFPEFHIGSEAGAGEGGGNTRRQQKDTKADLMWIAEYERSGLKSAMAALAGMNTNDRAMKALQVFINVTDLYGQIYVQKDIGVQRS